MHLQFITEPTIGAKERRLIRSHVMKGKNAGRPRPSRRTLHNTTSAVDQGARDAILPKVDQMNRGVPEVLYYKHNLGQKSILWNDLILPAFPEYVSTEQRKFIHQCLRITANTLYPQEFCSEVDLSQYIWFQYVLEDTAYFHCLLAVATFFAGHFGGSPMVYSDSLKHISQAYKLINERLSGPEALSDQAIAVVTMFAVFQRIHHQQANGLVHFEGLRRMIQLRGCLVKVAKENRALAQKPWRLALEFALQDGSPTGLSLWDVPSGAGLL
ncbi:Nn.00g042820.m01.CDS01 [Neocucurbitaria sp. VM-36]